MLARYLGSKTALLDPLVGTIMEHTEPGGHVVDAFSGSLAVSLALKERGLRVTANDINLFSSVFASAFLIPNEPPNPDITALLPVQRIEELFEPARTRVHSLRGTVGYTFLEDPEWRRRYVNYVVLMMHLQTMTVQHLPASARASHFYDTYSEDGANSAYVSSRGSAGNRRFFSGENARRLDLLLNQIRYWKRSFQIDIVTSSMLLSGAVRAMEKVANTQGTFHDFIRSGWDSRALHSLQLSPPPLDSMVGGAGGHAAGREQDSLDFMANVDHHSVLYLDPPYNFRQYSAYYFLPNVVCRYPDMDDPDEYFAGVKYVRGQNPSDDFTSTFCKGSRFITDMRTLISRAQCETVAISYYNGANHWGTFDTGPSNVGRERLTELLSEDLFVDGSLQVTEITRRNYASYGGFKAREVSELLFVAQKRQDGPHATERGSTRRVRQLA